MKGTIFRSKARWYIKGENNTKYLFNLERLRSCQKAMKCVVRDDGSIARKQNEIPDTQPQFYYKLYKANPEIEFCLENQSGPRMSQDEKEWADREIILEEMHSALKA